MVPPMDPYAYVCGASMKDPTSFVEREEVEIDVKIFSTRTMR
jgi:hypothetical protein